MIIAARENPRVRAVVAGVPLLGGSVCWALAFAPGVQRAGDRGEATPERGWGDLQPYLVPGWVVALLVVGTLALLLVATSVVFGALDRSLPAPAATAIVLAGAAAAALGWLTGRQDVATDAGFYAFAGMLATFLAACLAALPLPYRRVSVVGGGIGAATLAAAVVVVLLVLPGVWTARGISSMTAARGPSAGSPGVPSGMAWRSSGDDLHFLGVHAGRPIVERLLGAPGDCRTEVQGLDPRTGAVAWRWSHETNYCALGYGARGNDHALYLASFDVTLDPGTGRTLHPAGGDVHDVFGYLSADAVAVSRDGSTVMVRGIDPASGHVRWQRRMPSCAAAHGSFDAPVRPVPALSRVIDAGERAVATYLCPTPLRSTGVPSVTDFRSAVVRVWSIDRAGSSAGDHVQALPGSVPLSLREALDNDPDVAYETQLRYLAGTAYVGYGASESRLAAVDPASGSLRWTASGVGPAYAATGGRVFAGTARPNGVASLSAATGADRRSYPGPVPDAVAGSLAYADDPRMLNRLIVFDLATGTARRAYPSGLGSVLTVDLAAGAVITSANHAVIGWR